MASKIGSVLFTVLIIAGVFWWKSSQEGDASEAYRQLVVDAYTGVCESEEEAVYITGLVELYHDEAFASAYQPGRRRRSASMNSAGYFSMIHFEIRAHMEKDEATEFAQRCEPAYQALLADAVEND